MEVTNAKEGKWETKRDIKSTGSSDVLWTLALQKFHITYSLGNHLTALNYAKPHVYIIAVYHSVSACAVSTGEWPVTSQRGCG